MGFLGFHRGERFYRVLQGYRFWSIGFSGAFPGLPQGHSPDSGRLARGLPGPGKARKLVETIDASADLCLGPAKGCPETVPFCFRMSSPFRFFLYFPFWGFLVFHEPRIKQNPWLILIWGVSPFSGDSSLLEGTPPNSGWVYYSWVNITVSFLGEGSPSRIDRIGSGDISNRRCSF